MFCDLAFEHHGMSLSEQVSFVIAHTAKQTIQENYTFDLATTGIPECLDLSKFFQHGTPRLLPLFKAIWYTNVEYQCANTSCYHPVLCTLGHYCVLSH